jgi:hypothetical protein
VLFGSQARGEAGPHSDVDLLVVVPDVVDRRTAAAEMYAALRGIPIGTDIVVMSPSGRRIAARHGSRASPTLTSGPVLMTFSALMGVAPSAFAVTPWSVRAPHQDVAAGPASVRRPT